MTKPKVLLWDIETAPILGYVWGLWENNVALNQIHTDWYVLSWAAKWLGDPASSVMYMDQRNARNMENDKVIMLALWNLLNKADVVVTQNGKAFDQKKVNARFVMHGFPPPAPFKHIDTKILAQRCFAFTSNKLEYMTDKLCVKYKKLKHKKFAGFEMWRECLAGNIDAWKEMEKYNKYDVLSLEELYLKLAPWDSQVNFTLYDNDVSKCKCGSKNIQKRGYHYGKASKTQRYKCMDCGHWTHGRKNLLTTDQKNSVRVGIPD